MTTDSRQAPYAPVSNVLTVIRRMRERGLPEIITAQELTRLGVPDGNTSRTLFALRFLDLIDEDGRRTELFNRLGRATSSEYPEILSDILKTAYAPVFTILDPADASEINLHDAFRSYSPQAQRERMVVLFTALCREAGLVAGGPIEQRARSKPRAERRQTPVAPASWHPAEATTPPPVRGFSLFDSPPPKPNRDRYRLLHDLVDQLPEDGHWTPDRRALWLSAVEANVAFLIQVDDSDHRGAADED